MIFALSFLAFGVACFVVALAPSLPSDIRSFVLRLSRSSAKTVRDVAALSEGNIARGVFQWSKIEDREK